jgi:putative ABC transport system permease protein
VRAVRRAWRRGLAGRRTQALVIGLVVLVSAAASTLAAGLLVDANAPFDHAFNAQRGAQVAVTVDTALASPRQLAAAMRRPGITAAAGPFAQATVAGQTRYRGVSGVSELPPFTLAGRASAGGPVDDLTLEQGQWPRRPGQVAMAGDLAAYLGLSLGQQITLTGVPGQPKLTVVGIADSITQTAGGWVVPAQIAALHTPPTAQVLLRWASAGSGSAVAADVAQVRAALPPGALVSAQSWLSVKLQAAGSIAPWVPFIVAFSLIGLVLSVLIVVNVVSGAVVAGTRRIGVLKSIGFTPAQVVAAYMLQVAVPAVTGCVIGVTVGNLLAGPLLAQGAGLFRVGHLGLPWWVSLAVPLAMLGLTGAAALVTALRAGRMSTVQAIATGRAPRPAHGYAAHRLLGRAGALPRAVTIGLAAPFTRPARTVVTLAAILFGAVAVTFGAGLASSLDRAALDLSQAQAEPVIVGLPGLPGPANPGTPAKDLPSLAAQQRAAVSALRAQPGTLRYVAEADGRISVPGIARPVALTAFGGDAAWTGYAMVSGHWFRGSGQAVVNTFFLTATGKKVGGTFTLTSGRRHVTMRITGEVFDPGQGATVLTSLATVSRIDPALRPVQYDVALRPGINAQAYRNALSARLGREYSIVPPGGDSEFTIVTQLVAVLTAALVVVAGLGVLNTVLLQIRERAHDIGVFKALGMTPRQTTAMVVCSVAGIGLVAGLIAVPAGVALQRFVVPVMGHAAQTDLPASVLNVYRPAELALLALAGLVIAAAAALFPAGRAARGSAASALRAE